MKYALMLTALLGTATAAAPTDTLVIQQGAEISTLDPAQAYDPVSYSVIENLYETLVTFSGNTLSTPQPALATRWAVTPDGRAYTFTLRKNVKFHSGNPLTCLDAAYSLRRQLVTNNPDSGNWFLAEALLGTSSNAADDDTVTWKTISGAVTCNAAGQLVLRLPKPDPTLISKLAAQNSSIVDRLWAIKQGEWPGTETTWKSWVGKDLTDSGLSRNPSGTGAYRLVRRDASTTLATAFGSYWGGAPKIKNVIVQYVPEGAAREQALARGDADFIDVAENAALPSLRALPGVTVTDGLSSLSVPVIFMNVNVKPGLTGTLRPDFFKDLNVRRAFNYAFNDALYIKDVTSGRAQPRAMALPTGFLGYNAAVPGYAYSEQRATAAFKQAFGGRLWTEGFTLPVYYATGNTESQATLELLKATIERINPKFRVNVLPKPYAELLSDAKDGRLALGLATWGPDYADPDNVMYTLYASDGYYSARTGFADEQIDSWLTRAQQTVDAATRAELYRKVATRANDLAPYIVLPSESSYLVHRSVVRGVNTATFSPLLGGGVLWKALSK